MHSNKVSVSIITCIYNGSDFIESYIDNMLKLYHVIDEVIIVNDGSTDDTLKKIMTLTQGLEKFKILSKPNSGLADSRNFGVVNVSSDYVIFLDVDDIIPHESLCLGIRRIESDSGNIDFLYGNVIYFSNVDNQLRNNIVSILKSFFTPDEKKIGEKIFFNNYIVTPGNCIFKTKLVLDNLFDSNISIGEDWDFFTRVFYKSKGLYCPNYKIKYFVHSGSMSTVMSNDRMRLSILHQKLLENSTLTDFMPKELYSSYLNLNFQFFSLRKSIGTVNYYELFKVLISLFFSTRKFTFFKIFNSFKLVLLKVF